MAIQYKLITPSSTGVNIQYFSDIRDWFIAFMNYELKVNSSLAYLKLIEESEKDITLNLYEKLTNELILTVYSCSDILEDYTYKNGLYYPDCSETVQEIKEDEEQLEEYNKDYTEDNLLIMSDLVGRHGMMLTEIKEFFFDFWIYEEIFNRNSYDVLIDNVRIYFN